MPSYDGVIPAHKIFQDRAFACALTPDHRDLRQVQVAVLSDGTEGVLQPVHQRDQLLHPPVAHGYGAARMRPAREPPGAADFAILKYTLRSRERKQRANFK